MLAAVLIAATLVSQFTPSWVALGERAVTNDVARDTITVRGANGTSRN